MIGKVSPAMDRRSPGSRPATRWVAVSVNTLGLDRHDSVQADHGDVPALRAHRGAGRRHREPRRDRQARAAGRRRDRPGRYRPGARPPRHGPRGPVHAAPRTTRRWPGSHEEELATLRRQPAQRHRAGRCGSHARPRAGPAAVRVGRSPERRHGCRASGRSLADPFLEVRNSPRGSVARRLTVSSVKH